MPRSRKHKAPRGGLNGYVAWNRSHLVRSFLGLPVPPKEFRHPDFAEAFAKVDAENNNAAPGASSKVKVHVDSSDADEKDGKLGSREVFDPVVYHNSDIFTPHTVAIEGDESIFSFGTLEDWWFQLVHDASWPTLIGGEIMLEGIVIFTCGCLLTIAQMLEGGDGTAGDFKDNLLLALTTVRLSTDKIFGWQPTTASSPLEVCVLALYGWTHWLMLSIASALIVARALRPARSGLFSPDCVVNDDSVQVRFMVLRNQMQDGMGFLYNMEFTMQGMTVGGQTVDMPLIRNKYALWRNGNNIITLRHSVKDDKSPFNDGYPGGRQKVRDIFVTLSAMDMDGNSVLMSAVFLDPQLMDPTVEKKLRPFSRILHNHKFVDMYRVARHPETGQMATSDPKFVCNLDNFIKTAPIQEGDPGYIMSAPDKPPDE